MLNSVNAKAIVQLMLLYCHRMALERQKWEISLARELKGDDSDEQRQLIAQTELSQIGQEAGIYNEQLAGPPFALYCTM